jgi:hypothetical protein
MANRAIVVASGGSCQTGRPPGKVASGRPIVTERERGLDQFGVQEDLGVQDL